MKPPSENHDIIRWLDGEMTESQGATFEAQLKTDPALAKEVEEMRALSADIRAHLPADMKVPHADFFNSQIQVRIAQMEMDEAKVTHAAVPTWSALLQWMRQPWFATAGAAVLAIAAFLLLKPSPDQPGESFILSSYAPNAKVQARSFHDATAEATVLMLDGLDAIPAEKKVSGFNAQSSQSDSEFAATTLFDTTGAPLLMISRDASGTPLIWINSPNG